MDTLYIEYAGSSHRWLEYAVARSGSGTFAAFARRLAVDSFSRRNPRTAEYMARLVSDEVSPDDILQVTRPSDLDSGRIAAARSIVLLWRDANGCGSAAIERVVFRHKQSSCPVRVVNGRRRTFELAPKIRRRFLLRRFLEKSLLLETCVFIGLLAATPFLLVCDAARGRN